MLAKNISAKQEWKGKWQWRGEKELSLERSGASVPSPCKILMYLTPELGKAAGSWGSFWARAGAAMATLRTSLNYQDCSLQFGRLQGQYLASFLPRQPVNSSFQHTCVISMVYSWDMPTKATLSLMCLYIQLHPHKVSTTCLKASKNEGVGSYGSKCPQALKSWKFFPTVEVHTVQKE